jgi:hypothetical protein
MMIAEPLTPHRNTEKQWLTAHVPISGFEELNTVRLATGIITSDLSGNDPLFPQNYTAWTTPTQLIKKKRQCVIDYLQQPCQPFFELQEAMHST